MSACGAAACQIDQFAPGLQLAGAQRGNGQCFEASGHRAATRRAGGQAAHLQHVEHRFLRAVEFGQADDAVDQQHTEQPWVVQLAAARDALVEIAQRLVVVADLLQLVREIAMQHRIEAAPVRGARVAQRLVHVGKGLLRAPLSRIAAGDGVEQHAALLVLQHLQALFAQRQHLLERRSELAFAPQAARQPGAGQDVAGAIVQRLELLLRQGEFGRGLGRRAEVQQVVADGQPRPGLTGYVVVGNSRLQRLARQLDRARGVLVKQLPRLAGQAQPFRRSRRCPQTRHARIIDFAHLARYGPTPNNQGWCGTVTCCAGTARRPRTAPW